MEIHSRKGSLWQIWDLHVHTPHSHEYTGDFDSLIKSATDSKACAIGVNDYCTLSGYEEIVRRGGIPGKVCFPVVEFRMNNLLATKRVPGGVRINFHIIFDNDPTLFQKIKNWLSSLECFDEKSKRSQLGIIQDLANVSFDYTAVIESLKAFGLYGTHALVWLPYDEYGGIDEINPIGDGYFKLGIINDAHILGSSTKKQIDFFKWQDTKFTQNQYEQWFGNPKPCIKGSDTHNANYPIGCLKNEHSQPIEKYCWINADLTFQGLKQIVNEPDRVFIGEEPPLLQRIRSNRTKFIKSLSVSKISSATTEDVWFDKFDIELNGGLVAIIGNKGSGKSAITDIISLCGNTQQSPSNFSFLTGQKFRRVKPQNLSAQFKAKLQWADELEVELLLNENPRTDAPERVKYLPQNFLERLCTEIDSELFEQELKTIIYSHTPQDRRLGKASLDELINYKSDIVNQEIDQLKSDIGKANLRIVELESRATVQFKNLVENQLTLKQGELFAHTESKPVQPPSSEPLANDDKTAAIELLRADIQRLEEDVANANNEKNKSTKIREDLQRAYDYYYGLNEQLRKHLDPRNEYAEILTQNGISPNEVFSFKIETIQIQSKLSACIASLEEVTKATDQDIIGSKAAILKQKNDELKSATEELDRPAKLQQKYFDDLKLWEKQKADIEGSRETEGTLNYLQEQLEYLKTKLSADITARREERATLAKELFRKKKSLVEIRRDLFQPVSTYIEDFHELKQRYDVKIDVALELKSFAETFFSYITQQKIGTYSGKEDGYKRVQEFIDSSSFTTEEEALGFIEAIEQSLKKDMRNSANSPVDILTQLKRGVELSKLYDFLYFGEYLQPTYYLKLGNKTLQELSPGERGALLLIFYLILDNDDMPLIIDQPEENLDNESVYHILVHFIKKVKERRQIVIVTHNPNLAVVCDADQIIHMNIEKDKKNTIRFVSGGIENPQINRSIINILEGTLPAFNNRDSKYVKSFVKPLVVFPQPVDVHLATDTTAENAAQSF